MTAKRRKILVAGGAGFIGSHLCDRLVARGDDVICVDSLWTGRTINVRQLIGRPNFRFLRHDVTNPLRFRIDQIFNLACPAALRRCAEDSIHTVRTNVIGSMNLLDLAKRHGAAILLASTSESYGDPAEHPQHESYFGNVNSVGPRACYDEGKRCAETLFMEYRRNHGLDAKIVRIFNTYGPRMVVDDGRVISNFIVQVLNGEPLTIFGSGEQTRSFCYVDDLVEAMLRVMDSDQSFAGPVNIGNDEEVSIIRLAEKIAALCGAAVRLRKLALPVDDPRRRRPALELVRSTFSWTPKINLDEGLRRTIEYFRGEVVRFPSIGPATAGPARQRRRRLRAKSKGRSR